MMWRKLGPAYLAGIFGAAGSVLGKLSGLPITEHSTVLRILTVFLMILVNTYVLTLFMRALHQCGSTLQATVVTNACSYLSSAILGYLCFDETSSVMWWFGLLFIMGGLYLIVREEEQAEDFKEENTLLNKNKRQ